MKINGKWVKLNIDCHQYIIDGKVWIDVERDPYDYERERINRPASLWEVYLKFPDHNNTDLGYLKLKEAQQTAFTSLEISLMKALL